VGSRDPIFAFALRLSAGLCRELISLFNNNESRLIRYCCSTYKILAGGIGDVGIVDGLLFTEAADLADSALANGALKSAKKVKRRKRRCSMKIEWE
jgi:hypothetical protein